MTIARDPKFAMIAVLSAAIFVSSADAETIQIVAPSGVDDREGNTFIPSERNLPYRAQELYLASDFQGLPDGGAWLIGLSDRADASQRSGVTVGYRDMKITVGMTTSHNLARNFSDNLGSMAMVVHDGPDEVEYVVEDGALNPFTDFTPFLMPFPYDPAQGNLVVEWITRSGEDALVRWDSQQAPGRRGNSGDPDDTSASFFYDNSFIQQFTFVPKGDINYDGTLDSSDIDDLSSAGFDLNGDGATDEKDRTFWVRDIMSTWFGDSNLDGEFSTEDMVAVFQAGKYELDMDAGWAEGDWTGDQRFGSEDMVAAFQDGGFELGARAAVSAVPEPSCAILLGIGMIGLSRLRKRR